MLVDDMIYNLIRSSGSRHFPYNPHEDMESFPHIQGNFVRAAGLGRTVSHWAVASPGELAISRRNRIANSPTWHVVYSICTEQLGKQTTLALRKRIQTSLLPEEHSPTNAIGFDTPPDDIPGDLLANHWHSLPSAEFAALETTVPFHEATAVISILGTLITRQTTGPTG
jgi:hypothetical protein